MSLKSGKKYLFKSVPNFSLCVYATPGGTRLFLLKLPRFTHYGSSICMNCFEVHRGEYLSLDNSDEVFFVRQVSSASDFMADCSDFFFCNRPEL